MRLSCQQFQGFVPVCLFLALMAQTANGIAANVRTERVPNRGIQPQVVMEDSGQVHLVFLQGDPKAADVFYSRRAAGSDQWSDPIRVNREAGSAVGIGTIRGAQLALGRNGRVHVVWNGSSKAKPQHSGGAPMMYARSDEKGGVFEPERNLMSLTQHLDGGGSVAADDAGNVYVAFHASVLGNKGGEEERTIFVARSTDDGKTFAVEGPAAIPAAGACSCCGLKAAAGKDGLLMAYRTARQKVNRDMVLLWSKDGGTTFRAAPLGSWQGPTCPMSSTAIIPVKTGWVAAWEIGPQVYFARVPAGDDVEPKAIAAPGTGRRKHPRVAVNDSGQTLLVWADGTGWNKGGSLGWQIFGEDGKPVGEPGRQGGLPVWSFPAVFATSNGDFVVLY